MSSVELRKHSYCWTPDGGGRVASRSAPRAFYEQLSVALIPLTRQFHEHPKVGIHEMQPGAIQPTVGGGDVQLSGMRTQRLRREQVAHREGGIGVNNAQVDEGRSRRRAPARPI
jgi:hypothetical protein